MATTELEIRQLADEGGTTPIAPVTVTDAVLKGDGTTLTEELASLNNGLTRNKKGTSVDLSNRTTDYTFPADGYLVASAGGAASAIAIVELRDSTTAFIGTLGGYGNSNYPSWTTFVRAGMIARIRNVSNSGNVTFVPLVSN